MCRHPSGDILRKSYRSRMLITLLSLLLCLVGRVVRTVRHWLVSFFALRPLEESALNLEEEVNPTVGDEELKAREWGTFSRPKMAETITQNDSQ